MEEKDLFFKNQLNYLKKNQLFRSYIPSFNRGEIQSIWPLICLQKETQHFISPSVLYPLQLTLFSQKPILKIVIIPCIFQLMVLINC